MASDGEISCTNDPNFAVIYSFLKVFGKLYGLCVPTIAELQEFIENTQEVLDPLKDIHLRLLRRALKSVQSNKWEKYLIKFCHQHGHHQEAWEMERFSYKKASTQVKLKVLKVLLEYQFTCHPKFKTAVNAISSKELRLDPIGRDKNGCVYWYQVDQEANLCLFKEDQDEETWQLVARNREELVKVITQLKNGEEVCPLITSNNNEDSSSAEIPPPLESNKPQDDDDNEEEFLSPESESEHEETQKVEKTPEQKSEETEEESKNDNIETNTETKEEEKSVEGPTETPSNTNVETHSETPIENPIVNVTEDVKELDTHNDESPKNKCDQEEVSEAIEEPVMIVTGEGNGVDCESSYIIGDEIIEDVMYFFGEGCGFDNDTGNPEAIEQANTPDENSEEENGNEECVNGEHQEIGNLSSKNKISKSVKLKSNIPSVTKRTLRKQSNDTSDTLKSESKKHCVRNSDKSETSKPLEREGSVNDKSTTDTETSRKNNIKKSISKVKKKIDVTKHIQHDKKEVINSVSEVDNGHDSKSSIIEKRKSSVSSVDQDDGDHIDNNKEASPDKEIKAEDPLPPKKLRLETTPESDVNISHSKDIVDKVDNVNNSENIENTSKDPEDVENAVINRKKIKANKGKFKRKKFLKNTNDNDPLLEKSIDKDSVKDKKSKSLKRSLLDATMSDKNKSESQSETEDDEPVTKGKRQKIKPKKIITTTRKKVEAKLLEKQSSDESEEETLYSIAGKKSNKKVLKKKPKGKEKTKEKDKKKTDPRSDESDVAPVRQSRRIAQMKIKEEAERRHLEEVALREMKMIHKKKNKEEEEEEEWRASGGSSGAGARRRRGAGAWRAADSSGPDADSDSDEPLFELHDEPDLDYSKSDHEFSPESDLESGEPVEPIKRARTLHEESAHSGGCRRCGSGEQPEWILLCDRCDAGYHASCLKPLLLHVPDGDWFCPPCNHDMLIASLEKELSNYDELVTSVEAERARKKLEEPEKQSSDEKENQEKENQEKEKEETEASGSSSWSSSSEEEAVYRLRARRQLPVSYRAQEYDRLISSAIKEEYVEPTTSAGNQGRGKDISTIIEAAEEEKLKAEREAIEQGKPIEVKKMRKKTRRKPRKLNSLEVPSEDDDETDEDFKDTGMESSSEDISSSAERDSSSDSGSSDSLPIRRTGRTDKKERPKMTESSPEVKKKKKGVFDDSSSESGGTKEWSNKPSKPKHSRPKSRPPKKRDKSKRSRKRGGGLTQYDAEGNVIRARVTYGGLSDDGPNDWSPKHRTRQRKINYTEMPNTESEDEMHKSSGKHMPDSSDEFKLEESELSSDSGSERGGSSAAAAGVSGTVAATGVDGDRQRALTDLIKTAVVPLEKLPEDVTKAKTEELQAHLNAQQEAAAAAAAGRAAGAARGRGGRGRGVRGARGGRGRPAAAGTAGTAGPAAPPPAADDALAKLVGVKIKDLRTDGTVLRPNQAERERKRQEREAKQAEKEARKLERLQKKEEKEKLKEQKAKEREEKKLAKLALQESKRMKKEKPEYPISGPVGPVGPVGYGVPIRASGADVQRMTMYGAPPPPPPRLPADYPDQRFPAQPRLQVRAELRGVLAPDRRPPAAALRDGTLSVAGSPQPFKPITEEPSIITRMPHMINQQYRGPMMYPGGNSAYGLRGQNVGMYPLHPGMGPAAGRQYPPQYYPALRAPPYPLRAAAAHAHAFPAPPPHPHASPGPGPGPGPGPVPVPVPVSPAATPPAPTPPAGAPEPPIKIKAEVKTEPEYRTPPASPRPPSPRDELPRNHPKIKHTENKDRRPRYPLGPYAPQYASYGPYAPDLGLQRPPYQPPPPPPRPPPCPPYAEARPDGPRPATAPDHSIIKREAGEEGGVFGGLVSYFSSQHADDMDA